MKRLVTRSDFDGLACAMMLKELNLIDDIKFVHPKDVQDGKVELSENDITTNLPYDPRVGIAFDHHESEIDRLKATETGGKLIIDPKARSAARVVYDYYGGKKALPRITDELIEAVDKGDSADFSIDEILNPSKWVLLHYIMDPRTGLGRFHDFRISNYDLMMELIDKCLELSIDEIMDYVYENEYENVNIKAFIEFFELNAYKSPKENKILLISFLLQKIFKEKGFLEELEKNDCVIIDIDNISNEINKVLNKVNNYKKFLEYIESEYGEERYDIEIILNSYEKATKIGLIKMKNNLIIMK